MIRLMEEIQHSIKVAAKRCGLSTHVIRVWEKRYDAVSPNRTDTNRRLYSEEEIERLGLLRMATVAGHSIGNIARLPTEKLRDLVSSFAAQERKLQAPPSATTAIAMAVERVREMDSPGLELLLGKAAAAHGQHGMLESVIAPLATQVGELWLRGDITAAHEHFASAVIRNFLVRSSRPFALQGNTPTIVVTTPAGQLHELGAVMVAAAANDLGWRVVYLGTSLPAAEIAGAANQHQARAVALSIVFPADDASLPAELAVLREQLPPDTCVIAGGRAAGSYRTALHELRIQEAKDLSELYPILESLQTPRGAA